MWSHPSFIRTCIWGDIWRLLCSECIVCCEMQRFPLIEVCIKIARGALYIYRCRFPTSWLWIQLFWDKALGPFKTVPLLRAAAQAFKRLGDDLVNLCVLIGPPERCILFLFSLSVVLLPSDPEALFSWWSVSHSKDNLWMLTLGWPVRSLLSSRPYLSGSLCLQGLTSEVVCVLSAVALKGRPRCHHILAEWPPGSHLPSLDFSFPPLASWVAPGSCFTFLRPQFQHLKTEIQRKNWAHRLAQTWCSWGERLAELFLENPCCTITLDIKTSMSYTLVGAQGIPKSKDPLQHWHQPHPGQLTPWPPDV